MTYICFASQKYLGRMRKSSYDSWYTHWDWNPGPHGYEPGMIRDSAKEWLRQHRIFWLFFSRSRRMLG